MWNRSGTPNESTNTLESFILDFGDLVVGWTLLWTTVCRLMRTVYCCSVAQLLLESSGVPCWRRPTPSEWNMLVHAGL